MWNKVEKETIRDRDLTLDHNLVSKDMMPGVREMGTLWSKNHNCRLIKFVLNDGREEFGFFSVE